MVSYLRGWRQRRAAAATRRDAENELNEQWWRSMQVAIANRPGMKSLFPSDADVAAEAYCYDHPVKESTLMPAFRLSSTNGTPQTTQILLKGVNITDALDAVTAEYKVGSLHRVTLTGHMRLDLDHAADVVLQSVPGYDEWAAARATLRDEIAAKQMALDYWHRSGYRVLPTGVIRTDAAISSLLCHGCSTMVREDQVHDCPQTAITRLTEFAHAPA